MLTQITKDDTFVQSLIDEGRITEEEAHTHPQRSLLLRAITGQDVDPSLTIREARAGDRYLLCSDGLSGVVSDETLADTLRAYRDPRECADRHDRPRAARRRPGQHHLHRRRRRGHRLRRGRADHRRAAGDGREDTPPPDSAAARASATTLTRTAPLRVHAGRPRRRPPAAAGSGWRWACVAVLAVLVGGGVLARMWVLQQYYVGRRRRARRDLPGGARRACSGCRCSTRWPSRPTSR